MDPEGDEGGDARGIVSDAEVDVSPCFPQEEEEEEAEASGAGQELVVENAEQQQQQYFEQQQQPWQPPPQQQQIPPFPPAWPLPMNPLPPPPNAGGMVQPQPPTSQHALAMAQYYEARMRDHAAAYASAAAGAAWAAAQIAAQAAEFAANAHASLGPDALPPPPFDAAGASLPPALALPPPGVGAGVYYPAVAAAADPSVHNNGGGVYPASLIPLGVDPNHYSNNNNGGNMNFPMSQQQQQQQQHHFQSRAHLDREADLDLPWHAHHDNQDDPYTHRNNRRKRSQRRPPGGISIPRQQPTSGKGNNNNNNSNSNDNDVSRVRRRLRDGGDSSNSSCCSGSLGTSITSYNSDQAMSGNTLSSNNNYNSRGSNYGNNNSNQRRNSSGSGGRGNHYHRYKKKQRQPPDDSSLLGKTGVSALYEFCNKRRMTEPSFAVLTPTADLESGETSKEERGDFEMAVYLEDGVEWGRGRGRTKGAAKHEAARKALLSLVPGVIFDPESGIVVELPPTIMPYAAAPGSHHRGENAETSASLEDLAPHLASRLAIASGDNEEMVSRTSGSAASHCADYSAKTLKRSLNINPGTTSTTTSDEEDDNAYYASRGASVCSVLLHAMVQIDERIMEAPQYAFKVSKVPTANAQMKRKGPASSCSSAIVIHRGSFTCTATLKVKPRPAVYTAGNGKGGTSETNHDEVASDTEPQAGDDVVSEKCTDQGKGQPKDHRVEDEEKPTAELVTRTDSLETAEEGATQGTTQATVLEAVGVGGTKRESKHTASAKLLALLFPECENMVQVKATAEAARERYAASKALNKQSNRGLTKSNDRRRHNRRGERSMSLSSSTGFSRLNEFYAPARNDPPLPFHLARELRSILGIEHHSKLSIIGSQVASFEKLNINQEGTDEHAAASATPSSHGQDTEQRASLLNPSSPTAAHESVCRQLSRQKQLEKEVDKALQALNEHDEEGRSLPDELTADDVGRTVLRRAEPGDMERIQRLLSNDESTTGGHSLSPVSVLGTAAPDDAANGADYQRRAKPQNDDGSLVLRVWGSSTFVLLLCRAIAAFEDPPLGCAILTLGFSMENGKILRVSQIGSETHLPRERFLECLEAFAACMHCALERNEARHDREQQMNGMRLSVGDLRAVVGSHVGLRDRPFSGTRVLLDRSHGVSRASDRSHGAGVSAPLQSVLEESEGGDDSDKSAEAIGKLKGQDKPSKRSRVE